MKYLHLLQGTLLPPSVIYLFYCEVTFGFFKVITMGTFNIDDTKECFFHHIIATTCAHSVYMCMISSDRLA